MSDIRLVNVVPIVNGWNDAAKKNLEEAKTLMASGNHLDYNAGVVFARKKTGTEVQHHSGGQKGKRPRHQLRLVFVSAFGRKSLYGMKGERLYDADYEVRRIDGRFRPAGC